MSDKAADRAVEIARRWIGRSYMNGYFGSGILPEPRLDPLTTSCSEFVTWVATRLSGCDLATVGSHGSTLEHELGLGSAITLLGLPPVGGSPRLGDLVFYQRSHDIVLGGCTAYHVMLLSRENPDWVLGACEVYGRVVEKRRDVYAAHVAGHTRPWEELGVRRLDWSAVENIVRWRVHR